MQGPSRLGQIVEEASETAQKAIVLKSEHGFPD
jgi:hypothetical protein